MYVRGPSKLDPAVALELHVDVAETACGCDLVPWHAVASHRSQSPHRTGWDGSVHSLHQSLHTGASLGAAPSARYGSIAAIARLELESERIVISDARRQCC